MNFRVREIEERAALLDSLHRVQMINEALRRFDMIIATKECS